jgi:hypothetical protein
MCTPDASQTNDGEHVAYCYLDRLKLGIFVCFPVLHQKYEQFAVSISCSDLSDRLPSVEVEGSAIWGCSYSHEELA